LRALVGLQFQLDLLGLWQLYPPDSPRDGSETGGAGGAAKGTEAGLG
jgi:hypothetical protein